MIPQNNAKFSKLYWTLGEPTHPGRIQHGLHRQHPQRPYQRRKKSKAMSSSARLGKPVGSANRGEISSVEDFGGAPKFAKKELGRVNSGLQLNDLKWCPVT